MDRAFFQLCLPNPLQSKRLEEVRMQILGLLPSRLSRPRGARPPSGLTKTTPRIWAINQVGALLSFLTESPSFQLWLGSAQPVSWEHG